MTEYVKLHEFGGGAGVTEGKLARVVRALAQNDALRAASGVSDLTDNSGGAAADGTIAAIPDVTPYDSAGTDLATKAAVETALGTVTEALAEIADQVIAVNAVVPARTVTNSLADVTDGTVAAVTQSFTASATDGANAAGLNTVLGNVKNTVAQLAWEINQLCEATGVAKLTDNSGGTPVYTGTVADIDTGDTGTDGTTDATSRRTLTPPSRRSPTR